MKKKKNLRIMSKQYAHLHAMAKTSVKFQNDWPKTVGGVALTSQLLTKGQTDERTGHGTPISHLRANAGATKTGVCRGISYFSHFCSKHRLWVFVRTASLLPRDSNEYPQSMF